jgi:hypothetical protein
VNCFAVRKFIQAFSSGGCSMRNLVTKSSLVVLAAGALALGGCATTKSVQQAQATADQALSTAQSAQSSAQNAQDSADAANAAAQRAQATADQANQAASAAAAAAAARPQPGERG